MIQKIKNKITDIVKQHWALPVIILLCLFEFFGPDIFPRISLIKYKYIKYIEFPQYLFEEYLEIYRQTPVLSPPMAVMFLLHLWYTVRAIVYVFQEKWLKGFGGLFLSFATAAVGGWIGFLAAMYYSGF